MKIAEVNYTDLPGRIFNGYDLHLALIEQGMEAVQIVRSKQSRTESVIQLDIDVNRHAAMRIYEYEHSVSNLIYPYGKQIAGLIDSLGVDIAHYHILHLGVASLFDYLLMLKCDSVWTIHDPWVTTGNCVHPLSCDKWLTSCHDCDRLNEPGFEMAGDGVSAMWQCKREVFAKINPHIVVSTEWMKSRLERSPLTSHFDKIHVIPFGVKSVIDDIQRKHEAKCAFGVDGLTVVGFRAEDNPVKGCSYIYDALRAIKGRYAGRIFVMVVGNGSVPDDIKSDFSVAELGFADSETMNEFYKVCDIFLMPSLAESFGLMAVEAMAMSDTVVCFKDTVLEEITASPDCGVAVEYESSDKLAEAIAHLLDNTDEVRLRGITGREHVMNNYMFGDYVDRHVKLYEQIYEDKVRCANREVSDENY